MNEIKLLFILSVFLYTTFNCYLEESFDLTTFNSTFNGYDIQEIKKKEKGLVNDALRTYNFEKHSDFVAPISTKVNYDENTLDQAIYNEILLHTKDKDDILLKEAENHVEGALDKYGYLHNQIDSISLNDNDNELYLEDRTHNRLDHRLDHAVYHK